MSTMKCRCGSDDKLIIVKGIITRKADNKPHVCLGNQDTIAPEPPTPAEAAAEIGIIPAPGETYTIEKIRAAYKHIRLIEKTLLDEDVEVYDGKLQNNLPKLGMIMKMVDNILKEKPHDL